MYLPRAESGRADKGRRLEPVPPVWQELAKNVRRFKPDVCILVARKMPRLLEALSLDFGDCLSISDLAIPYSFKHLRGARVAIIDDVVNVGSTLAKAHGQVVACNPLDVRMFAIGRRHGAAPAAQIDYVFDQALTHENYTAIVSEVPKLLMTLAKPYDLEFPVIQCRFASPISSSWQFASQLRLEFPPERIHDFGIHSEDRGLGRITLDLPFSYELNRKLRFYYCEEDQTCNLASFMIPSNLSLLLDSKMDPVTEDLVLKSLQYCGSFAWDGVPFPREAEIRLRLFMSSWKSGLAALDEQLSRLLVLNELDSLSAFDVEMLFGPELSRDILSSAKRFLLNSPNDTEQYTDLAMSPVRFIPRLNEQIGGTFDNRVRERAGIRHEEALFRAIFDEVADIVGAENPDNYSLEWPFCRDMVKLNPFLRLKVGPTFFDLVETMIRLTGESSLESAKNLVSTLLDKRIDSGAIVPAISRFDDVYVRIYRKGENKDRDTVVDRMLYALESYNKPLNLTRIAKVAAILSFSSEFKDVIWPCAFKRGNIASLRETSVDLTSPGIADYLRDIGAIKENN